jgi:hypothetical protein
MEQLQQANVGQGENIANSLQAAEYAPLKYQMDLGTKLMEQGFSNASETNRHMASINSAEAATKERYRREDLDQRRADRDFQRGQIGTLTAIINEFDDAIVNANMNDPAVARKMPAVMRKREQLQRLLELGGRNPQYLAAILGRNATTGSLSPQVQAALVDRPYNPKEKPEQGETAKKPEEAKENDWHNNPSSNVIK